MFLLFSYFHFHQVFSPQLWKKSPRFSALLLFLQNTLVALVIFQVLYVLDIGINAVCRDGCRQGGGRFAESGLDRPGVHGWGYPHEFDPMATTKPLASSQVHGGWNPHEQKSSKFALGPLTEDMGGFPHP